MGRLAIGEARRRQNRGGVLLHGGMSVAASLGLHHPSDGELNGGPTWGSPCPSWQLLRDFQGTLLTFGWALDKAKQSYPFILATS